MKKNSLSRGEPPKTEKLFPVITKAAIAQLVTQIKDSTSPAKNRRQAASALAKMDSIEAMQVISALIRDSGIPPHVIASMAEGLGENPRADAKNILLALLESEDELAGRSAVRSLGLRGDADALDILSRVLHDSEKAQAVREEAALVMGEIDEPAATSELIKAMSEIHDDEITEYILDGLGQRPIGETEEFFRNFLDSPKTSAELKVAAIDALANAPGEVTPLLMKYARDSDPEIRAAVGGALAATDEQGSAGTALLDLMEHEAEPEVRATFYQALENQSDVDFAKAFAMVKNESNLSAKLAGLNLLAAASKSSPDILDYFNQSALTELKTTALNGARMQDRLIAAIAIRKVNSAESLSALQEIARQSTDQKVVEAANSGLRMRGRQ